jgi:hypothetical protein
MSEINQQVAISNLGTTKLMRGNDDFTSKLMGKKCGIVVDLGEGSCFINRTCVG